MIPGQTSTPVEVRKATLRSMRKLLPRMALTSYASAVLHPLIKVASCTNTPVRKRPYTHTHTHDFTHTTSHTPAPLVKVLDGPQRLHSSPPLH